MPRPKINPAVGLVPIANGYLGYDAEADLLYEITTQNALALELIDGSRTENEIIALAPERARASVRAWLAEGHKSGLLLNGEPEPPRWLSAKELHELADRLAHEARMELAIEVQEKAAARAPGEAGHWHQLGLMRQIAGQRERAVEAYERYLELQPDDAFMRHRMAALKDDAAPERASDASMVQEFDSFSAHYDARMRGTLRYEAPERLLERLWREAGDVSGPEFNFDALDLGCGTGLVGVGLKPRAAFLAGIDLSPGMLAVARELGIYDLLEEAEITGWLENFNLTQSFDAVTACDCLVYFGDLGRVIRGVAKRLKPGGWFAFTVERSEEMPHKLMDSGRYKHHENYVREVAAAAKLEVRSIEEGFLRYEGGVPVAGLYSVLRKPLA